MNADHRLTTVLVNQVTLRELMHYWSTEMNPISSLTRAKFRVKLNSLAYEAKLIRQEEA
jgi:hypothetical protein